VAAILKDLKAAEYYKEEESVENDNNPVENLKELVKAAGKHETLRDFLNFIRKVQAASKSRKGCAIGTGHAAKGLEFGTVCLIQCTEGILPHKRSTDLLEEANIFFVMASRAEQRLHISYSGQKAGLLILNKETTKHCNRCNLNFPATLDYFYATKNNRDALSHTCMECIKLLRRSSYVPKIRQIEDHSQDEKLECYRCRLFKPREEFWKRPNTPWRGGKETRCKSCSRTQKQLGYKKNVEKARKRQAEWRNNNLEKQEN